MLTKPKKQTKLSTLEGYAWTEFSKFIRLRDCLKTTDTTTHGRCYTCGAYKEFSELDAGHYIKSTHKQIKFDERNVHAQCQKCNRFEGGQEAVYTLKMLDEYGREVIDELMSKKGSYKFTREELIELRKKYKQKGGQNE